VQLIGRSLAVGFNYQFEQKQLSSVLTRNRYETKTSSRTLDYGNFHNFILKTRLFADKNYSPWRLLFGLTSANPRLARTTSPPPTPPNVLNAMLLSRSRLDEAGSGAKTKSVISDRTCAGRTVVCDCRKRARGLNGLFLKRAR